MSSSLTDSYITQTNDNQSDLNLVINEWIRHITKLPEKLVRPRWQPSAPKLPEMDVNWCAFGVSTFNPDTNPAFVQLDDDATLLERHEVVTLLGSFYGPNSQSIARRFIDDISIPQNNYQLNKLGLTLFRCSPARHVPELINNQWYARYDVTLSLKRKVEREYPVKTLLIADSKILGD